MTRNKPWYLLQKYRTSARYIGYMLTSNEQGEHAAVRTSETPGGMPEVIVSRDFSELVDEIRAAYQNLRPRQRVRRNPVKRIGRRALAYGGKRKRNPSRPPRGASMVSKLTELDLKVRRAGGYVEQMKYQDADDYQRYVHDFGDLSAFMYLCDSVLGRCIVIVPGDASTPLWELA